MTAFLAAAVALAAPAVPPSVAVRMTKVSEADARTVLVTVDGHELRLLVQPKSLATVLDAAAAARIALGTDEPVRPAAPGKSVHAFVATVCRYTLGGQSGGLLRVGVADLSGAGMPGTVDGVLGADLLTAHAARVDSATDTLHVRPRTRPAAGRLAGHWTCTGVDTHDGPGGAARAAATSYDFDGDRARFKTRRMDEQYYFNAYESEAPARLVMYRDGPPIGGKRAITWQTAVYKLSGDTLTVLSQDAGDTPVWDDLPKDFKPAKNFCVMHFKRTGPAAPFPAVPAPAKP